MLSSSTARTPGLAQFDRAHIVPALALWEGTPGIGMSFGDDRESLDRFIRRNDGLCFVAIDRAIVADSTAYRTAAPPDATPPEHSLVGTILAGEDGRRGYLYHLAVAKDRRTLGIGRALVDAALAGLAGRGIKRCHAIVFANNTDGLAFWERIGFRLREDLSIVSVDVAQTSSN